MLRRASDWEEDELRIEKVQLGRRAGQRAPIAVAARLPSGSDRRGNETLIGRENHRSVAPEDGQLDTLKVTDEEIRIAAVELFGTWDKNRPHSPNPPPFQDQVGLVAILPYDEVQQVVSGMIVEDAPVNLAEEAPDRPGVVVEAERTDPERPHVESRKEEPPHL